MCGPATITGTTAGATTSYSSGQLLPKAEQIDSQKKAAIDRIFYTFKFIQPDQKKDFVVINILFVRGKLPFPVEIFHLMASFLVPDPYNLEPMLEHKDQLLSLQLYKRGEPDQRRKISPNITKASDYFYINCNHEDETHRNIFIKTMVEKNAMAFIISTINTLTENEWTETTEGRKMQLDLASVLLKVIEFVSFHPHVFLLQWDDSKNMVYTMSMLPLPQTEKGTSENKIKINIFENCERLICGILLLLSDENYEEGIQLLSEYVPLQLFALLRFWSLSPISYEDENLIEQTSIVELLNLFRDKGPLKPTLIRLSNDFYHEKEKLRKGLLFGTGDDKISSLPLAEEYNKHTKGIKIVPGELPCFLDVVAWMTHLSYE